MVALCRPAAIERDDESRINGKIFDAVHVRAHRTLVPAAALRDVGPPLRDRSATCENPAPAVDADAAEQRQEGPGREPEQDHDRDIHSHAPLLSSVTTAPCLRACASPGMEGSRKRLRRLGKSSAGLWIGFGTGVISEKLQARGDHRRQVSRVRPAKKLASRLRAEKLVMGKHHPGHDRVTVAPCQPDGFRPRPIARVPERGWCFAHGAVETVGRGSNVGTVGAPLLRIGQVRCTRPEQKRHGRGAEEPCDEK